MISRERGSYGGKMKAFHFFLTRIFLRKPIFAIGTLTLLFLANYTVFSTARTVFSAREGYEQMARINAEGTFMASLDPDATVDIDRLISMMLEEKGTSTIL